ncbi:MAG: DUF167 family protein [Pyrinomonadaceae bacterium]|nr:YggU family protein [Chloracidobacterium sp.]MBP7415115.1 YggU family protein [Pyrinomonadaceae bacterium]
MIDIVEKESALTFPIRVVPRASRTEIVGIHDGALKVRIASPPVDGAANIEIVRFLAKTFGVSKGDVFIISGETSKNKRIKIKNLSKSSFEEKIK